MKRLVLALAALAVLLSSCTLATGSQTLNSSDMALFQRGFMSSYYAEREGAPGGYHRGMDALTPFLSSGTKSSSRATVAINKLASAAWSDLVGKTTTISGDYPEPGQTTSFTVTLVSGSVGALDAVYDIAATTTYPTADARKTYLEEYYVRDNSVDTGTWTTNDPVVKGPSWDPDQAARTQMVLTFKDGSKRTETLVASSTPNSSVACPLFDPAPFAVDGSLDLSQAFIPAKFDTSSAANANKQAMYSSVVMYYVTPAKSYNFWFWTGTSAQTILGVRYYTEIADTVARTYTNYTASFEKTVDELTTTGGGFTSTLKTVTAGSTFTTLAESVLRQKVVYGLDTTTAAYPLPSGAGTTTTNMQTRVVNIAGKKDFILTQLNNDQASLVSWASSTIYIPTGNDDEILAGDPSLGVFTRDQQVSPATGTSAFTTDTTGYGDLGVLYTSITEGAAASAVTAPSAVTGNSNLMSGNTEYSFGGSNYVGTVLDSSVDLSSKGTVEAWVYINAQTNTAGVIHKGVSSDFSDECWSLQGWGSSGQFAIVLDQPGTGNTYDIVTTAKNLNTGKWYYLAATWDTATKKINLYVNGKLSSSGTMSKTANGVRDNSSQVVIGSQVTSAYGTSGYFGLNGKIVGANARASAMTASEISAQYAAVSPYTTNW